MKASFVLIMLITGVGTGSSLPTLSLLAGCRPLTLPSSVTPAAHDSVCRKRPESLIPESLIIFDKQKLFLITIVKLSASTGKGTEENMCGTNRPNNGFPGKVKSNHNMMIFTEAALNRAKQTAEALYLNNP